ncbi:MAG TPA: hypothetical protein VFH51_19840, partial [Myxococcota bacterium]|nr:hypothetical protein [Myxococcota bacterium]
MEPPTSAHGPAQPALSLTRPGAQQREPLTDAGITDWAEQLTGPLSVAERRELVEVAKAVCHEAAPPEHNREVVWVVA